MRENQASIVEWSNETFGPSASLLRLAGRANTEMAELVREATSERLDAMAEESADTAIVLCRVAAAMEMTVNFDGMSSVQGGTRGAVNMVLFANRCLSDLLLDIGAGGVPAFRSELMSRTFMALRHVCETAGTTLADAVDAKMIINRERRWVIAGDGTGSHDRTQDAHHARVEEAAVV